MTFSDIGSKLLQCNGQGWQIDLFVDEHIKTEYICCFCHNVCKDAVELSCDADHDDDAIQLYCQKCLLLDISAHNDNCPIDDHQKPTYVPNRRSRGKINKAKVYCPNSSFYQGAVKGQNIIETSDEKEGINNNNNVVPSAAENTCKFEGSLSQLITHISECAQSNLASAEIQAEIIKMIQNDINGIKDENKITLKNYQELKNMISIQSNIITVLKRQQNERLAKLENTIINVEEENKQMDQLQDMMNKLQTTVETQQNKINKLQTENKNMVEQHKSAVNMLQNKINKLEKVTKSQNDLVSQIFEEKKEKEAQEKKEREAQEKKEREAQLAETLLSSNEFDQLLRWLPGKEPTLTLLYKASKDGYDYKIYYNKIDKKAPTVCIIQAENGNIFGGYTEVQPEINKGDTRDLAAFIFVLKSTNKNVQRKWTANDSATWTVRMQSSYGPIFGGDVFYVEKNMKEGHSLAKTSKAFNHPKDNSFFGGAEDYIIVDVEVFSVQ